LNAPTKAGWNMNVIRKYATVIVLCFFICVMPAKSQREQVDTETTLQIVSALNAISQDDVHTANQCWRAAQTSMDSSLAPGTYADVRYYYVTHWLGRSMIVEDRTSEAEQWLRDACLRPSLMASLRNNDVRATVDVYSEILRKNGKPNEAQSVRELWNEINTMSPSTVPALSATAGALQNTPTAGAASLSAFSNTPSATDLLNGSPARKKALEDLKRDLLAAPSVVSAGNESRK
jgi:hypothetical protein